MYPCLLRLFYLFWSALFLQRSQLFKTLCIRVYIRDHGCVFFVYTRVSLWHHGPADAINYATASRAQLRRRLVLIISPFGGPLEIFANSRPAGDTTEILRCRPTRYDRSRGKRESRLSLSTWFCTIDTGTIGTRSWNASDQSGGRDSSRSF